ncbi:hypothetical protein MRX96_030011 [Rhipicephalus microplus]
MSYSDDTASEIKSATSSRLDSSAVTTSSPHDRLSHFIDDSCLKTIALEDDASTAEETRALRSNSPANMDTAQDEALHKTVVLHFDKSYPFTIVGALRIAILDTVLWGVLALLFLVSSSLLIHNKMLYQRAYFAIVDWTCSLFLVSGIFGLGCVCSCFALGVLRLCRHKAPLRLSSGVANQDIMMSPITIS